MESRDCEGFDGDGGSEMGIAGEVKVAELFDDGSEFRFGFGFGFGIGHGSLGKTEGSWGSLIDFFLSCSIQ